jgi:hypothetical protein
MVQLRAGVRDFSFLQRVQTLSGARSLYAEGCFPVCYVVWGCDDECLPLCNVKFKNEWSYTSTSTLSVCGLHRDNFAFHIFCYLSHFL